MSRGQFRSAPYFVVFAGQSLNIMPGPALCYPTQLMGDYFPAVPYANVAIGSMSWTNLSVIQAANVNIHANGGLTTILIMCGGTADVFIENDTGATLYAQEVAYANAARAAGFNHIIGTTITSTTAFSPGQNTERSNHNTLLLADASAAFDSVVDLAGDPRLDDPADATYYADGTHWTSAGAQAAADLVFPALDLYIN